METFETCCTSGNLNCMTSDACYVTRGTANKYVAPLPAQLLPFTSFSKRRKKSKMSRGFVCMVVVSAVFTPGPVQLQKLQFDGSMPALLTGFETHPLDFFRLLVS